MFVAPSNAVSVRHGHEGATNGDGMRGHQPKGSDRARGRVPRPRWESRAAVPHWETARAGSAVPGTAAETAAPARSKRRGHGPIGDGSTAYTGKQPNQPGKPVPLEPGETPPQFVIFSWDGAGEVGNGLFPRFLKLAEDHGAHMTFFLSGLYLLPESKKRLYRPPNNPVGRLRHRLPHRRPHQDDAEVRPPGLARRPRDRHPLQRPLLRRHRHRRQLDARAVAQRDRPGEVLRQGVADQHRLAPTCPRCPSTTTRNSSAAAPPVCSARTTCCPPPASSAGATTPPRPAASSSGPEERQGLWDLPLQADARSPGTPSRSSRWTTTSSPTSR